MSKGVLILIDENGDEIQFYSETSADMVKHNNAGTDTTVADLLNGIFSGETEIESLTQKQDKSEVLTAFSNLTLSQDKLPYATGQNSFGMTDFKEGGREILSKATAREIRKALGIYRELFLDEVEVNRWIKVGEPTISNLNAKFTHALQTNGGGIYMQTPIEFGEKDFTIAFFGYLDPASMSYSILFNASDYSGSGIRPYDITLCRYDTNNSLTFGIFDANGAEVFVQHGINFNPCDGVHYYEIDYHHDAQTIEIFGDFQLILSKNSITIPRVKRFLALGYLIDNASSTSTASISEFTLLDGVTRSSGSCTVPTAPFEVTANTLSLLHFD